MTIRPVAPEDRARWCALRIALWPDGAEDHPREIDQWYRGQRAEPAAVLVAEHDGDLVGFVELSIRAYAEGCDSQNVAYLEGWYVAPDWRGRGLGRQLIEASENWGRQQGCQEFASDAEVDNPSSIAAHHACGFADTGVIRCFRKPLQPVAGEN